MSVLQALRHPLIASQSGRFVDLGLDRSAIGATLRASLAQRLVRRVCPHCAEQVAGAVSPEEAQLAQVYKVEPVVRARGCQRCGGTGYHGRLPLVEVLTVTPQIADLIAQGATPSELQRTAVEAGMRPVREIAREGVQAGLTTVEEVARVLGEDMEEKEEEKEEEEKEAGAVAPERLHVLLVDDDPLSRRVARDSLERSGFRVSEAGDGLAALERIRMQEQYSLVVLDLQMPKVDGEGVLAELRGSVRTASLPVVVLTGSDVHDAREREVRLMELGADDYIRKPIDPPHFLARINAVLRRAGILTGLSHK